MSDNMHSEINTKIIARTKHLENFKLTEEIGVQIEYIKLLLGTFYQDLHDHFRELFFQTNSTTQFDFIVLCSNRMTMFYELFYMILFEEATLEEKQILEEKRKIFITEDYLLSNIAIFEEKIQEGKISSILLTIDYSFDHKEINNILDEFKMATEKRTGISTTLMKSTHKILFNHIEISIIYRTSQPTELKIQYKSRIKSKIPMNNCYEYLSRSNVLMKEIPLSNNKYFFSYITEHVQKLPEIIGDFYKKDEYFFYLPKIKLPFVAGIHVADNAISIKKTIIPFVFFPKLSQEDHIKLITEISNRWSGWTNIHFPKHTKLEFEGIVFFLGMSLLKNFFNSLGSSIDIELNTFSFCTNFQIYEDEILQSLFEPNVLFNELDFINLQTSVFGNPLTSYSTSNLKINNITDDKEVTTFIDCYTFKKVIEEQKKFLEKRQYRIDFDLSSEVNEFKLQINKGNTNIDIDIFCNILMSFCNSKLEEVIIQSKNGSYTQGLRIGLEALFIYPKKYTLKIMNLLAYHQNQGSDTPENLLYFLKEDYTKFNLQELATEEKLNKFINYFYSINAYFEYFRKIFRTEIIISRIKKLETQNKNT